MLKITQAIAHLFIRKLTEDELKFVQEDFRTGSFQLLDNIDKTGAKSLS
jgi:hypothetical protein